MSVRSRRSTADAVVGAALLLAAVVSVGRAVRPVDQLAVDARTRVGWELANRAALMEGVLPLWNPYSFGGRPHFADANTQALYPPHLVLKFLPPHWMFPVSAALHLWLFGFGAYLLARRLADGVAPALLAAAGVTMALIAASERELAYISGLNHLAWLPSLVLLSWQSLERSDWPPRPMTVAAAAMAMMASPRGAAYALAAVLASAGLAVAGRTVGPRAVLRYIGALVLLSGGLSAVQTGPGVQLWAATLPHGGLTADVPTADSHHNREPTGATVNEPLASSLRALEGRVVSACPRAADAGQLAASRVRTADGYGGMVLADYARFAHLAAGGEPQRRVEFTGLTRTASGAARADLLRLAAVSHLLACEDVDPRLWTPVRGAIVSGLYRSARPVSRAFWTCGPEAGTCDETRPAQVLRADQTNGEMLVAVDAPRDGIVFFSETFYPVRVASVDGQPVETRKVNLAFTAVPVPAGIHRVALRYDQTFVVAGAAITVATAVAWPALLVAAWRRERRAAT